VLASATVVYFFMQPPAAPKVSKIVQLTHDGQPKGLIGTEGSRLYIGLFGSDYVGMAEMSTAGGELQRLPMLPSNNMGPIGLSDDGSQFLVVDGHGVPPTGPLWSVPVLGGSPRRLAEAEGFSGSWSQNDRQLVYANRNNLFLANADGSNSHKLASLPRLPSSQILYSAPTGKR